MLSRENKFIFTSYGMDKDVFTVVSFKGIEGLSTLYRFEITLISENSYIHPGDVIKNRAQFIIKRKDGKDAKFNGVISSFEQLHRVDEYTFYRATLVPKLWYLTLTYHNQVFLEKDVKEIVEIVLKDGGLTPNDYEFKIKGSYPKNEYVCQYNETHFNFISRWMEREGLYYYFDQTGDIEKIIITDTKISHLPHPLGDIFYYSPPSGLDYEKRDEIIQSFVCKYNNIPKRVFLKDYNYRKPSLEISGSAVVDKEGIGDVYLYGEHFETPEEGNRLAKIRAEQILCTKEEYLGDSTIPYVQPGYIFKLEKHYRDDVNKNYLVGEVQHEGAQGGYLLSGISKHLSEREKKVFYQNSFKAIPSNVQFRPEKKTKKPLIAGTLNAKIDAEGSGKYAELDEHGRYKVKLPFDISGRRDGKASSWIRLATPYAGSNHGMHFPLHKGTEVLITFINGDPDRPVIAAAVPNPENPSQVVDKNQTMNIITTSGGNKIHIQDQEGKQGILLHTPIDNTHFRMGAPLESENHGGEEGHEKHKDSFKDVFSKKFFREGGVELLTDGRFKVEAGIFNQTTLGEHGLFVGGMHNKVILLDANDVVLGAEISMKVTSSLEYKRDNIIWKNEEVRFHGVTMESKDEHVLIKGNGMIVSGENTTVTGENTTVKGKNTKVTGEHTEVTGNNTTVTGDNTVVTGEHTRVTGNNTTVEGDNTSVRGSGTIVTGDKNVIIGNKNEIKGSNNEISGSNNKISGNSNHINGNKNVIAGLVCLL